MESGASATQAGCGSEHSDSPHIGEPSDAGPERAPPAGRSKESEVRRPLRGLSVAELQARHLEVLGRPSRSEDVRYLRWRVQQAERGRLRVGEARRDRIEGGVADFKVLPFRVEGVVVERLDEARLRLGLASRSDLLRRALHDYLFRAGEREVAGLFLAEGVTPAVS